MIDYRKLIIALVIAVLFAILVQTSIEAVKENPKYEDFCNSTKFYPYPAYTDRPITEENATQVAEQQAYYSQCQEQYNDAMDQYNFIVFLVSAIAGLIAIIVGLYVSTATPVGLSIASGMLLGGLFSLFFGTLRGWGGIGLQIRPFIILIEILIVIWVSYKKLNVGMGKKK